MCGVLGGINVLWTENPTFELGHRGPDSNGIFSENNILLGHTRLSILDLSELGNQPMISKKGDLILVFNGEIYNHTEIRLLLTNLGYTFDSNSDTETLLHAWQEWGIDCLSKLNGIYSFGIYNRLKNKLILCRDPFGVKPLYIYQRDNLIAFSSEIKSFLKIKNFDCTLFLPALVDYLSFLWSAGRYTMYKYVFKVLPGEIWEFDVDSPLSYNVQNSHNNFYKGEYSISSENDLINELENSLLNAVKKQMSADVPIGFFLSGGLDSSLLVAMARSLFPNRKINCFTINSELNNDLDGFTDDLPYARKVAKFLNVDLHEFSSRSSFVSDFDKMIWHLDEPQADLAPIHVFHISQFARSIGIKVLIGGVGGDDLFSGYRRHVMLSFEDIIDLMPNFILSFGKAITNILPQKYPIFRRLKKITRDWGLPKNYRIMGYFNWLPDNEVIFDFLSEKVLLEVKDYNPYNFGLSILNENTLNLSDLDKLLLLEQKTFLVDHNLNYTDKLSMAVGVEARVPYLDFDVVNIAAIIPSHLKINGKETKYILKKVAEKYLPKDVIYRSKTGFGAPVRNMILKEFKPMIEERLSPEFLTKQGIFNSIKIQQIIKEHYSGKEDYSYTILGLLAIQSWLKQFDWKF